MRTADPLLNDYQQSFPLLSSPFATLGARHGLSEDEVLGRYGRWQAEGVVSRIGAVLAPHRVGTSTLAALAVPPERLAEVAGWVSALAEINHNYERENHYNLWFVATAPDQPHLDAVLADIARRSGCPLLVLPMVESYHIDLGFNLAGPRADRALRAAVPVGSAPRLPLSERGRALLGVLQEGLPLVAQPYQTLARQLGCTEVTLLADIARWQEEGVVKRFGVVVRHRELGYAANAMCVWQVPEEQISAIGQQLAAEGAVSLCYHRRPAGSDWPYNLYCMLHGQARQAVLATHADLNARLGLAAWPQAVLFSGECFKQRGACYQPGRAAA